MDDGSITLYVAASVDGFVADDDGGVAWLDEFGDAAESAGFDAFFESVDALVMGATTYEQVASFGEWPYGDRPTYVLTRRDRSPATGSVQFVSGPVEDVADDLTRQYDHVWLVGGAETARAFLRAGAVDELRLTLVPVLLGSGVALFGDDGQRRDLDLIEARERAHGLVEVRYAVGP